MYLHNLLKHLWSKGVLAECESVAARYEAFCLKSEQGEIQYAALTPEKRRKIQRRKSD